MLGRITVKVYVVGKRVAVVQWVCFSLVTIAVNENTFFCIFAFCHPQEPTGNGVLPLDQHREFFRASQTHATNIACCYIPI